MVAALLVVGGILALLFYVVHRVKPRRFMLTAEFWKIRFNVEVESEPAAAQPPDEARKDIPEGDRGLQPGRRLA